mmetsp:Transcript_7674/g.11619  ORF Transcript_7674/g.11619 Transcript_7674/m.11619 type:complete len:201 (+) Transcript_7674:406-1008(+)
MALGFFKSAFRITKRNNEKPNDSTKDPSKQHFLSRSLYLEILPAFKIIADQCREYLTTTGKFKKYYYKVEGKIIKTKIEMFSHATAKNMAEERKLYAALQKQKEETRAEQISAKLQKERYEQEYKQNQEKYKLELEKARKAIYWKNKKRNARLDEEDKLTKAKCDAELQQANKDRRRYLEREKKQKTHEYDVYTATTGII